MNKFSDCARNHYEKEFHDNFNKAIKHGMPLDYLNQFNYIETTNVQIDITQNMSDSEKEAVIIKELSSIMYHEINDIIDEGSHIDIVTSLKKPDIALQSERAANYALTVEVNRDTRLREIEKEKEKLVFKLYQLEQERIELEKPFPS